MIKIEITQSMLDFANKKEEQAKSEEWADSKSVTNFKARRAGFLGEAAFCERFGAESENTFGYDAIINNDSFDIKTKRSLHVPNVETWEGTVPGYSEQEPDYFAFFNIHFGKKTGEGKEARFYNPLAIYFGGVISWEDYFVKRYYVKEGQKYSTNPNAAHISQWNVDWKDLKDLPRIA